MTSEIVMAADTVMATDLMPALIFMVGGLLVPLFKGRAKSVYMLLIPVVGFFKPDPYSNRRSSLPGLWRFQPGAAPC